VFTRHSMFIAEFSIKRGSMEASKEIVRTQQVATLAAEDPDLDESAWFASDDGSRIFQFAAFRTNEGAPRHLALAHGPQRVRGLAEVGELTEFKVAGSQSKSGHALASGPDVRFHEICRHEQPGQFAFGRNVFYVLELACEPRHAQAVQRMIVEDFTPRVAHADPDIEEYVWFADENRSRFLQFASYRTSAGVLRHYETSNGTERVRRLFEICLLQNARIFGTLDAQARAAYAAPFWTHFKEFARLSPRATAGDLPSAGRQSATCAGVDRKDIGRT
jgi:hypothetical protein